MLTLKNVLSGLFARPATPSRPRPRRRPLRLECLEERTLLCNPGALDLTFDGDGKVTTGGAAETANDVALQTDGKIVVAGHGNSGNSQGDNFAVARYTASGALDSTFGGTGLVLTDVTKNKADRANAVAIQSNGKIIAAGYTTKQTSNQEWALVRYNTNGTLDSSFGSGGKVITNMGATNELINDIVVQPDGKIIAAGYTITASNHDFALVRYNPNGSLDTSFGTGGKVLTDFSGGADLIEGVTLQADGKIIVVGSTGIPLGSVIQFALARYSSNGSLDSTFGTGGKVTTPEAPGFGHSFAVQADGKIVVTGSNGGPILVARYSSNGVLDGTFGSNGVVSTPTWQFGPDADAYALGIQSDGRIVVAGEVNSDFAVFRYNTDGSLDTSFDTDGIAINDMGGEDNANALVIQSDGMIVTAGFTKANPAAGPADFALARYCA